MVFHYEHAVARGAHKHCTVLSLSHAVDKRNGFLSKRAEEGDVLELVVLIYLHASMRTYI